MRLHIIRIGIMHVIRTHKPDSCLLAHTYQLLVYDYEDACRNIEALYESSLKDDDMTIVKHMKEIVPEFKSSHSQYEALDK